ncbi:MAG: hypothetical protein ACE5NN_04045, partial [Candidatus Bathyarchaeia archaeon]
EEAEDLAEEATNLIKVLLDESDDGEENEGVEDGAEDDEEEVDVDDEDGEELENVDEEEREHIDDVDEHHEEEDEEQEADEDAKEDEEADDEEKEEDEKEHEARGEGTSEVEFRKIEVKSRGGEIRKTASGIMDGFFNGTAENLDIRFEATVELKGSNVEGHARLRIKATVDGERVELNAEWGVTGVIGEPSDLLFNGTGKAEVKVEGEESTKIEGITFGFKIDVDDASMVDIADGLSEDGLDVEHLIVSNSKIEKAEFVKKDDDRDGIDDEKELHEERKLEIKVSERTAKVESKIETEDMENKFEIDFEVERGISMELKYKNETEGEEEIEAKLDLRVLFLAIVEYIDNDTSGCLTENDTIVQTVDLKELDYTQPEVTTITSADGEAGYRFESVGNLNGFRFNITAVLFSTYALVDNTLVSPTETKITISITNFPFNDTTGVSALALQVKAASKMKIEKEDETMESEIKVKSDIAEGYFSWENWAMIDEVNRAVNHSFTKTDEGTLINLCYPHGSSIVHDPKLGVGIKVPLIPTHIFILITPELLIGTGITAIAITIAAIASSRGKKPLPAGFTPFV